ncbi:DUF7848 domain-containing protein [Streptomyces sp. 4N509B]|uniref:DUF7848 domain-containing protein n=1 Tax=Streptomyces sp. 4N509B TaxID=3457413 RepID=UPI003FD0D041
MHPIRRTAAWFLGADRAPGAPANGYDVECVNCGATSPHTHDDPMPVELWAIDHAARHGVTHSQFAATTLNYWSVVPIGAESQYRDAWRAGQLTDDGPGATVLLRPTLPLGSRAHARPGSRSVLSQAVEAVASVFRR